MAAQPEKDAFGRRERQPDGASLFRLETELHLARLRRLSLTGLKLKLAAVFIVGRANLEWHLAVAGVGQLESGAARPFAIGDVLLLRRDIADSVFVIGV